MDIAILIFDHLTALDAVGPYEVLRLIPGANVRMVGVATGPLMASGGLTIVATESIDDVVRTDILIVPGGDGVRLAMQDQHLLDWIRSCHRTASWTASVCTGSLILGAAGLLQGRSATSHWLARDQLAGLGAHAVDKRVVRDGKVITSAGVSAGIDMALTLVSLVSGEITAQAIQLGLEYDPEPPFDVGTPTKASKLLVAAVRKRAGLA